MAWSGGTSGLLPLSLVPPREQVELVEAALRSLDMRRLLILEAGEDAQVRQTRGQQGT